MASLISLIIIIIVSMLITKIASISLVHTGLSMEAARFQARSALTGVGFTTSEAETVTSHPLRRRIIMSLMLIGNAGIITAITSLLLTFVNPKENELAWWIKLLILGGATAILLLIAGSRTMDRFLSRIIEALLKKYTSLNVRDYAQLLRLYGEYSIYELKVEKDDWLVNKNLSELGLRHEGINILGITRTDNNYIGVPKGDTEIESGDILLLYGKSKRLKNLDERRRGRQGDTEHKKSIEEHESEKKKEEIKDKKGKVHRQKK